MAAIDKITILLLLISTSSFGQIKQDKYYHAGAGIVLSGSFYAFGSENINPIAPSLIAITGAFAKEQYDAMSGRRFSNSDFAVTAISGIITNVALHYIFKRKKRLRNKYLTFKKLENERI